MVIGITGSFGSGKTTVARILEKLGARVIDADSVGHRVIEENEIKSALIKEFGEEIVEGGRINRKTLANIVFSDKTKVLRLNQITHPKILKEIGSEIKSGQKELIVVVAPFLIEAGMLKMVDVAILIVAERKKITERLKEKGWDEEDIKRRMKFHPEDRERIERVQFIIDNNGRLTEIGAHVKKILGECIVNSK